MANTDMKILTVTLLGAYVAVTLGTGTVITIPGGGCTYQCPVVGASPVCGTDGRTYPSACHLECHSKARAKTGRVSAAVAVRSSGRCPEQPCICPAVVDPVCGTNGWTYPNRCQLECDSARHQRYGYPPIYVRSLGKCHSSGCVCDDRVQLVCGTDGRTYGNPCKLNCESRRQQNIGRPPIFISRYGRCPPQPCNCPPIVSPVCGTNGRSYRNICFLECSSRENVNNGWPAINLFAYNVCTEEKCLCPADVKPVCASNGNTYNNYCFLRCTNDRRYAVGQAPLEKLYDGPCKDCVCPMNYDPVCGSDGRTYGNLCELGCENQRRWYLHLPPLKYTKGDCGCNCQYIRKPVCASNFKTYPNECILGCENARRVHNGLPALHITKYGECGCDCDNLQLPVCGSDRRTYLNVCWFNCANFNLIRSGKPAISIVKNGSC